MAINMKKITVVTCMCVFVTAIILMEFTYIRNISRDRKNATTNENSNLTRPSLIMRQLKSIPDSSTDIISRTKINNRPLTAKVKRFIKEHSADVKDFNSQQLERLYERLGFR